MKLKFLKLDNRAVLPRKAFASDAGLDLVAIDVKYLEREGVLQYRTGLAVAIPEGYCGLLCPRSSIYITKNWLVNSVGVIDSGYQGEILLNFETRYTTFEKLPIYKIGDRIAQLIVLKLPNIEVAEVVSFKKKTNRNLGGFGSSGV